MGHALYRKYRPTTLKEVVGQDHITTTLSNAIEQNKIAHAYLFTGPRGVGKTSVARILAHAINSTDYQKKNTDIDIIEIDGASNRGIDEIRELRDKVYIAPTSSKYKVYIIDEVHMLTTQAFNAFLKTLEEPPEHAVFILATTDAHKLPETIISRTQRFNFNSVDQANLVKQLAKISKKEKIDITDDAVTIIAEHGQGSFRDAISMLDQLHDKSKTITASDVYSLLGVPSAELSTELIFLMENPQNLAGIATKIDELYKSGYQATGIADALQIKLRESIINNQDNISQKLALMGQLLEVARSYNPNTFLEIILLNYTKQNLKAGNSANKIADTPKISNTSESTSDNKLSKRSKPATIDNHKSSEIVYDSQLSEDVFSNLLQQLKSKYNTLYSIVRMADHEYIDNELLLTFKFAFHQKRVSEDINQKIISDLLKSITGSKTKITCLLDQSSLEKPQYTEATKENNNKTEDIKTLSNIFGGAELLES